MNRKLENRKDELLKVNFLPHFGQKNEDSELGYIDSKLKDSLWQTELSLSDLQTTKLQTHSTGQS